MCYTVTGIRWPECEAHNATIVEVKMIRDIAPRRHMPLWRGAEKAQCRLQITLLYECAESVCIFVGFQFEKFPL